MSWSIHVCQFGESASRCSVPKLEDLATLKMLKLNAQAQLVLSVLESVPRGM